MSSWPGRGPAAAAAEAVRLAERRAPGAAAAAVTALSQAQAASDDAGVSMAEHALGLVARGDGDLDASAVHLRRAIARAESSGLHGCAAEARMGLMGTLACRGDFAGALDQGDLAATAVSGAALARLRTQRATVLQWQGQFDQALDGYRRALPVLRRARDTMWLAQLHNNRGLVHCYRGDLGPAENDLRRATALFTELGMDAPATNTRQNLAVVAARRGDVPTALALFDEADAFFAERGEVDAMGLYDRCESLLAAHLVREARETARRAVEALAREGQTNYLAEARLLVAEAALLDGDASAAREAAAEARRAFSRQHRPTWVARARYLLLRANWCDGDCSARMLNDARRVGDALAAAGLDLGAADARLLAARVALHRGRPDVARAQLRLAGAAHRRGPVAMRSRAWHAEALLRLAAGDRAGAYRALRAGVALIDRYRATLGATELRAHASGHSVELAQLGIRLSCEDGNARRVLAWAERWRAGALRLRPVRPPADARLAADLTALRRAVAEVQQAAMTGQPVHSLRARQARLEEAVRHRSRHARGIHAGGPGKPPTMAELSQWLGDATLVEIVDDDGLLHAVVIKGGRAVLRRLSPAVEVHGALDRLRSSLRRLVFRHGSPAAVAAAQAAVSYGARRLDGLLLGPLAGDLGSGPLVVVPTGPLHAVPWSVLPTCGGRPVTVSPSASLWHQSRSSGNGEPKGGTVLVAGPGLTHATSEVRALGRSYRGAMTLTGRRSTCAAVCAALDGAALAHVAAHGHFRADNPLFSALDLVDGPLTVYDLEALDRAPRLLVLSACDSGLSDVRPGDELMGLAAAVLALGTRALVASTMPVPDDATRTLMVALHAGLRSGRTPATALARAQARVASGGSPTGAGFICMGAGHRPNLA